MSQELQPSSSEARPSVQPRPVEGTATATIEAAHEYAILCSLPLLAAGLAVANLVAIREVFMLLQGDELLTIISIATAVFCFGLGALFPAGLLGVARAREAGFLFFFWLAAIAAPAGVVFVRMLCPAVVRDSQVLTPVDAFVTASIVAGPMNLMAGCAMAFALSREMPPSGTNRSKYALILLGLAGGCGVFTYLIADRFPPLHVAFCVSILLLTTTAILGYRFGSAALVLSPPVWISLLVVITVSCSPLCQMLDFHSQQWVFGRDDVEVRSSPTGVVAFWKEGRQTMVTLNQVAMVHRGRVRRPGEVVETADIPLLLHPEPRRILVLGGSAPEVIEEILRYPTVSSVEYAMPEESVQEAFLKNTDLGYEINGAVEKGILVIHPGEGDVRGAIKGLAATYPYDVVLVDLPAPSNAFLNRFYTLQFLSDLKALLKPGGLVAVRVSRLERATPAQQTVVFSSFLRTFGRVFPGYILAGNATTLCIGGASPEPLPFDPAVLEQMRANRGLAIELGDKGSSGPALLRKGLPANDPRLAGAPVDRELRPATSFSSAVGWLTAMPLHVRTRAIFLLNVDMEMLIMILVGLGFAVTIVAIFIRRRAVLGASFGLCSGQFIAGVLMGVLLLGDQCAFGTLFRDVGILGTAFFIGGSSAAIIALARRGQSAYGSFVMAGLLLLLGIVAALTPGVLGVVAAASEPSLRLLHLFITLPLLSAVVGGSAGGLIPAAVSVMVAGRTRDQEATATPSCRADRAILAVGALSGALGLLFCAVLLLPVVTITGSCYFCALFASVGVIVLILARGE